MAFWERSTMVAAMTIFDQDPATLGQSVYLID